VVGTRRFPWERRPSAADASAVAGATSAPLREEPGVAAIAPWAGVARTEWVCLGAILFVAAAIRLGWIVLLPVDPDSDFLTFYQMAHHMADGRWLPTSYGWSRQGPGYPLVLAPLVALGGGVTAIGVANALLQTATVGCVWLLGRRFFGPPAALAGAALAAVLPGLWLYSTLVASENLTILLIVAIALVTSRGPRGWSALLLGALAAVLAYARPSYLPFAPFTAVALLDRDPRATFARVRWYLLGIALVFVPIATANLANGGRVLPIGAAGEELWLLNNERATGTWFDAVAADDYPFHGLTTDPVELSAAQRKLALQFIAANPGRFLDSLVQHHKINWTADRLSTFWTIGQAPDEKRDRVPWVGEVPGLTNGLYLAVLLLAAVAAVRFGRRTDLLLPFLFPLGYTFVLLAVVEGNDRYHAAMLPLLCVLAGAALVPLRNLRWAIPAVAVVWWLGPRVDAGAWSIAIVVLVPAVLIALDWLAGRVPRVAAIASGHPLPATIAAVAIVALPLAGVAGVATVADRQLADLTAVDPAGWQRDQSRPGESRTSLPLILLDSGTTPGVRQVSYPNAVPLAFAGDPAPEEIAGLNRTLTGLQPGTRYRFYLQVYDPGIDGDPGETLSVSLNGQPVWQRLPANAEAGAWRDVSVVWIADGPAVTIRVERRAGTDPAAARRPEPVVRNLHLYPKY
jgi:hypothetical protein